MYTDEAFYYNTAINHHQQQQPFSTSSPLCPLGGLEALCGGGHNTMNTASSQQEVVRRTIYVASIDVSMTAEQLTQLFSTCGTITNLRMCGDSHHSTRFAFVEFASPESADAALNLNQLHIGSSALRVAMAKAPINKSSTRTHSTSVSTSPSPSNTPVGGYGAIGQQTHSTVNANLPIYGLPPEKQDAVARTVYVGSVDVKIPGPKLVEFFVSTCGPVVKSRLAGDSYHDTRFAFIEFASLQSAQKALALSGTYIGNFPIKMSMAKAPILNDSAVVHYHPQPSPSPAVSLYPPTQSLYGPPVSYGYGHPQPLPQFQLPTFVDTSGSPGILLSSVKKRERSSHPSPTTTTLSNGGSLEEDRGPPAFKQQRNNSNSPPANSYANGQEHISLSPSSSSPPPSSTPALLSISPSSSASPPRTVTPHSTVAKTTTTRNTIEPEQDQDGSHSSFSSSSSSLNYKSKSTTSTSPQSSSSSSSSSQKSSEDKERGTTE